MFLKGRRSARLRFPTKKKPKVKRKWISLDPRHYFSLYAGHRGKIKEDQGGQDGIYYGLFFD
jgi:hypothetical protein